MLLFNADELSTILFFSVCNGLMRLLPMERRQSARGSKGGMRQDNTCRVLIFGASYRRLTITAPQAGVLYNTCTVCIGHVYLNERALGATKGLGKFASDSLSSLYGWLPNI